MGYWWAILLHENCICNCGRRRMNKKIFLLDNYDSFTYNIYHALARPGYEIIIRQPNQTTFREIKELEPHAIIFSPGPKAPADYPLMHELLSFYAGSKPILGVCLGMQVINEFFGGITIAAPQPVHGKVSEIEILGGNLFTGLGPSMSVARYHSLIVANVPQEMRITARRGTIVMAFEHKTYNIYGVQFHPESFMTPNGQIVFDNFINGF